MAQVIGLAASLVQTANAGVHLSTSLLHTFVGSANRAESDIADIAKDVELTATTLDSVGKVFERDGGTPIVSQKAIQDAESLVKRCEAVFAEIQQVLEKSRDVGKNGRELGTVSEFSWLTKGPRAELLSKRLESLKIGVQLLLQVLLLANEQSKGEVEDQTLGMERERIRDLHQRQEESFEAIQVLEHELYQISLSEDDPQQGSHAASRVPTIDLMVNTSNADPRSIYPRPGPASPRPPASSTAFPDDSDMFGSDGTPSDDDNEHISTRELIKCAGHVQTLLSGIHALRRTLEDASSAQTFPRQKVHRLYRRFCRKFESEMAASNSGTTSSAALPDYAPLPKPSMDAGTTERPEATVEPSYSAEPAETRPDQTQHPDQTEHLHHFHHYEDPTNTQLPGMKAHSDAPSRGSSKESSRLATAEDDSQAYQGSGEVHRTKTGRISKAKKGLKVHSCECGKSYTRAEHLRRHQKNHTSDDVVQCNLCGRTFYRRDLLERHMGRHKERRSSQHDEAASSAGPSSTPTTFNYTHTFQPTTSYGAPMSSTSSEASIPWILPPPSNRPAQGYTLISNKQMEIPNIATNDHATRQHYVEYDVRQPTLQPAPQPRTGPASPRCVSNQTHPPVSGPQQTTHTPTKQPSRYSATEHQKRSPRDAGFDHSARHSVSSHGYGSPVSSQKAHGNDQSFKREFDGVSGVNTAPRPTQGPASPRTVSRGAAIDSGGGPDGTTTHHSGFTPVNLRPSGSPQQNGSGHATARTAGADQNQWSSSSGFTPARRYPDPRRWHDRDPPEAMKNTVSSGKTGPHNSDQRALASQMIDVSACTNCQQLKQKCDTDSPCNNCRRHALRSGYLPEPNCRGQTLTDLAKDPHGGAPSEAPISEETSKFDVTRRYGGSVVNPASVAPEGEHFRAAPTDEVLQRLVEEAGPDKLLESRRADRKAFFESHWTQPQREPRITDEGQGSRTYDRSARGPDPQNESLSSRVNYAERQSRDSRTESQHEPHIVQTTERLPAKAASEAPESGDTASPPPEPADKTSEEWISWKRARLSEGTRRAAKRKREQEEGAANASAAASTEQQQGHPRNQPIAPETVEETDPAHKETKPHRRKKSKVEQGAKELESKSQKDGSAATKNAGRPDVVMGEREGNNKDIVESLLEDLTVPV